MSAALRITVTIPSELVDDVDRWERNRSRFVVQAVKRELQRRQDEALLHSLNQPHSEALQTANLDFNGWAAGFQSEEAPLVDITAGKAVHWVEGIGWKAG